MILLYGGQAKVCLTSSGFYHDFVFCTASRIEAEKTNNNQIRGGGALHLGSEAEKQKKSCSMKRKCACTLLIVRCPSKKKKSVDIDVRTQSRM